MAYLDFEKKDEPSLPVVTIVREYRPYVTLGIITLPSGVILASLERPWLNNKVEVSCIPSGNYECQWLERSGSGKYNRVWHVQDVKDRTEILFHAGNFVRHSLGCILVGVKHGVLGGEDAVLSSKVGLQLMRDELEDQAFTLVIS